MSEPSTDEASQRHQRQVYTATEHGDVDIPLAELLVNGELELYPEVTSKGYFKINLKGKHIAFQAGGYVGLIPINDRVAIDVQPRVPVRNMERLIHIAEHIPISLRPHLRSYGLNVEPLPSLLDMMCDAFLESVKEIRASGFYREYVHKDADTSFPRGRISITDTMRKHVAAGVQNKVVASWFEPSIDNDVNRLIKYTIWYLSQKYTGIKARTGTVRRTRELNEVFILFNSVSLDLERKFLLSPLIREPSNIGSVRSYYRQALYLALAITQDRGIEFGPSRSEVTLASMLISLEKIFEAYLREILRARILDRLQDIMVLDGNKDRPGGGKGHVFDQGYADDVASDTIATPDIVCMLHSAGEKLTSYPLIIDVKYKPVKLSSERDDIEQAITYGASYRAPHVMLAHPKSDNDRRGLYTLGHVSSITVYQYIYDLGADNLEDEETKFVQEVEKIIRSSRTSDV
jgi:5-methylcytosine-specific restriction enzyme subunit McrC